MQRSDILVKFLWEFHWLPGDFFHKKALSKPQKKHRRIHLQAGGRIISHNGDRRNNGAGYEGTKRHGAKIRNRAKMAEPKWLPISLTVFALALAFAFSCIRSCQDFLHCTLGFCLLSFSGEEVTPGALLAAALALTCCLCLDFRFCFHLGFGLCLWCCSI